MMRMLNNGHQELQRVDQLKQQLEQLNSVQSLPDNQQRFDQLVREVVAMILTGSTLDLVTELAQIFQDLHPLDKRVSIPPRSLQSP